MESEEDNALIIGNVVLLGKDALKLILRHGGTLGMNDLNSLGITSSLHKQTIWRRFSRGFLINFLTRTVTAASDIIDSAV